VIPLVIIGTGGTSRDIFDVVCDINDADDVPAFECVAFLDDNASLWGQVLHGVPVRGPIRAARDFRGCLFVNGIGSPQNYSRKPELIAQLDMPADRFATIVHPTASVSRTARIGLGSVIFQHVTVASSARIGEHVVVLPNSIVSHDVDVGDYTCVAGGVSISGSARIGRGCYIGTKAAIIGGATIGDGSLVGMGSVVLRDVPPGIIAAGNPARTLRAAASSFTVAAHDAT
jgi:sugar O-acyltransferase (sialic acid O-acetyltransferase NeuD family)